MQHSPLFANTYVVRAADLDDPDKKAFLDKYLRGWSMGLEFAHHNPMAAVHAVFEQFPTLATNVGPELGALSILQQQNVVRGDMSKRAGWGDHDMAAWQTFFDQIHALGQITNPIKAEDVCSNACIAAANDFDHDKVKADARSLRGARRARGDQSRRRPRAPLRPGRAGLIAARIDDAGGLAAARSSIRTSERGGPDGRQGESTGRRAWQHGEVPCQRLSSQSGLRDRRADEPVDQDQGASRPSSRAIRSSRISTRRCAATKPDAVSINSWPNSHAEYAIKAMNAGAHVFMEKPIATTNEDAEAVVAAARKNNRKLVLGYILRVHPSWMKFIELGQTLGKPLVMRLNLNQQSNGPAWMWHKNLIDSLIPIVDCGVHYVDVMCQLTGAKPVRVHGIGAALWADAAKPNYGHLHVTFDDGSVGWYEAGWGPMMSEVAFFVKDVVGPKGAVSIVPGHSDSKDQLEDVSDSADIDRHTKTDRIQYHHAEVGPDKNFIRKDEFISTEDEPNHQELCDREQAFFLKAINEDLDLTRVDGRGGQQPAHRAGRRAEHQREARGRARLTSGRLRTSGAADHSAAGRPHTGDC